MSFWSLSAIYISPHRYDNIGDTAQSGPLPGLSFSSQNVIAAERHASLHHASLSYFPINMYAYLCFSALFSQFFFWAPKKKTQAYISQQQQSY